MTARSRVERVFEERDRFDVGLLLIILTVIIYSGAGDLPGGDLLANALAAATFLFVLHTANARRSVQLAGALVVGALVVADIVMAVAYGSPSPTSPLAGACFALLTPLAILLRITRHRVVQLATVFGVLCIYVFVGLFFGYVYAAMDRIGASFFVSVERATAPEDIYFSFTTLTTLGYGDYVPATDLGRMVAVTEALIGQLYLVSAVALVVAGIGRDREDLSGGTKVEHRDPRPDDGPEPPPSEDGPSVES